MKFYPIPDPRGGSITKEMLADLKQANIITHNIGTFASPAHWYESTAIIPPAEGKGAKYWRDNATIWQPQRMSFEYIALERNADGTFFQMPLNFSDACFNILSPTAAQFYNQYQQHFPTIPRLIRKTMNRYDAGRLNFSSGPSEDFPLGIFIGDENTPDNEKLPTFPSNMALRFNPQNGQPEAFYIDEYVRTYPFDWRPSVPSVGSQRLSDEELVSALSGILASGMSLKEIVAAVKQLVAR